MRKSFLILSWALYDLANQFFALNIVSLYFPRWLTMEKLSPELFYSIAYGISMFFVAVLAPFLGELSDIKKNQRGFLVILTLISVVFTAALGFTSNVFVALIFFGIANFGCQEAIVFYNALMKKIAPEEKIGLVSGLGQMFGYIGAILALYLTKPVILTKGYQAAFLATGILFLVFATPCMIFVKDDKNENVVKNTAFKINIFQNPDFARLKDYLKAAFFLLCMVNTVILFMGVYAGKVFALGEDRLIDLIAFSTLFAILGSIISGILSDFFKEKESLLVVFILWAFCILGGSILRPPFHWLVGAIAGLSIGATWVILRAMVIRLVPKENIGGAFGVFNLVAYSSGIVGPVLWGIMLFIFSRFGENGYRISFFALILFVFTGLIFLLKIKEKKEYGEPV